MIWILGLATVGAGIILYAKLRLERHRAQVKNELRALSLGKIKLTGGVGTFVLTPVVEYYARGGYKTEAGVSYWIQADDKTLMLDVGANWKQAHPSPLVENLKQLQLDPGQLDGLVISHCHEDHVGGIRNERKHRFSLSKGPVALPLVPAWTPVPFTDSPHNPQPRLETVAHPVEIFPGMGLTGPLPAALFLIGVVWEQSLVFDLAGKGLVVVIGCGHPGVGTILDRVHHVFERPVYGVIGGVHLPVKGDRLRWGPIPLQWLVGSDRMPWNGLNTGDVDRAIARIEDHSPSIVAISPHDSSDWVIQRFSRYFGHRFRTLEVGRPIRLSGAGE